MNKTGNLIDIIKNKPNIAMNLSRASKIILTNYQQLGDYIAFVIITDDEVTPEIIISKKALREFATEVLEKTNE